MNIEYKSSDNPRIIAIQKIYGKFYNQNEDLNIDKHRFKKFIKETVDAQVDDMKKMLIPICEKSQKQEIEKLVKEIIKKQKKDPDYNYQNHEQIEIDNLVYEIFGLDKELIDEVETWYARRYPKLVRN